MDLSIYLAYSSAEAGLIHKQSAKTAWFGCRLSPYGTGIISTSSAIKNCNMLILTDETPISDHDPEQIATELFQMAYDLNCEKILMDFQRQPTTHSHSIINAVAARSPVPVGITEQYVKELNCPVFLSAPPLLDSLEKHIYPWRGHEIWLEIATDEACVRVSKDGCSYTQADPIAEYPHYDKNTCTAYGVNISDGSAFFHLRRGTVELRKLLKTTTDFSISTVIGLYQQLKDFP